MTVELADGTRLAIPIDVEAAGGAAIEAYIAAHLAAQAAPTDED